MIEDIRLFSRRILGLKSKGQRFGPVLHLPQPGHYGNLMIKYMVAKSLQKQSPSLKLSNFDMPYWDISCPEIACEPADRILTLPYDQFVHFAGLKRAIDRDRFDRFHWPGYGQRLEYFPDKESCRAMFDRPSEPGLVFDKDWIVCPIRASEILDAIHTGYTILPVDFYADIFSRTGLRPVFTGQTEANIYVDALRERFPRAEFVPHQSGISDFQTIRNATNIILPVSTFAWLAAWLSKAQYIAFPIFGLYDPRLFPFQDFIPVSDENYHFFKFPMQPAVPLDELLNAHAQIRGEWSECDAQHFLTEHGIVTATR